jgi:hypothetical protein
LETAGHDLARPHHLEQSMALTLTARQWLVILIFRSDGRIVHICIGVVRMDKMKLDPARFEPARRIAVQP